MCPRLPRRGRDARPRGSRAAGHGPRRSRPERARTGTAPRSSDIVASLLWRDGPVSTITTLASGVSPPCPAPGPPGAPTSWAATCDSASTGSRGREQPKAAPMPQPHAIRRRDAQREASPEHERGRRSGSGHATACWIRMRIGALPGHRRPLGRAGTGPRGIGSGINSARRDWPAAPHARLQCGNSLHASDPR